MSVWRVSVDGERRAARRPHLSASGIAAGSIVMVSVAVLISGCGSARARGPVPAAELDSSSAAEQQLWAVGREELWTQRLFRMHYDGPEGDGGFKLTLRLASPELFQITTVDRLTRRWWGLSVRGEMALLLDHRNKTYCRYGGEIEIAAIPLGPLPFRTLPALLLGRLPLEAATVAERAGDGVSFRDRRGRRWSAVLEDGRLTNWTLWGDDGPEVWWQIADGWALLSARRDGLQLRWRQVVAEPMTPPLVEMGIPAGYVPGDCEVGEDARSVGAR